MSTQNVRIRKMKPTRRSKKTVDHLLEVKSEAILFFQNKKYLESLKLLEEAIKLSPSDLELLFYEALCLYHLDSIDRASLIIEQLYEMDTDQVIPSLPKVCGIIFLKNGKFKKAQSLINRYLKQYPMDIQWLNMLGYSYEKSGQMADAEKVYRKVLAKDGSHANASNSLAYLYLSRPDKHVEASQLIEVALKRDPKNPAYLDTAGMLKIKRGELDEGVQQLKEALLHSPGNPEILFHLNEIMK